MRLFSRIIKKLLEQTACELVKKTNECIILTQDCMIRYINNVTINTLFLMIKIILNLRQYFQNFVNEIGIH